MQEYFIVVAACVGLAMLIWDCVEVGRNDAANLVNALMGARVLRRRIAVTIAAVAVILGASFSAPVMETARKGIFDPTVLTIQMALAIYVSVYFVDTVLLYGFSGFGMPVSTTACLVFELVGAALFLGRSGQRSMGKSRRGHGGYHCFHCDQRNCGLHGDASLPGSSARPSREP